MTGRACSYTIDPDEPPVVAVIRAVAVHENASPLELRPPLYDVGDPDALGAFLGGAGYESPVQFDYRGWDIGLTNESVVLG